MKLEVATRLADLVRGKHEGKVDDLCHITYT